MDGRLVFGLLLLLIAVVVGAILHHKKKLPKWVASSWASFRGFIGGLTGALLTLAFALGLILLLWFAWDWGYENVYLRFFNEAEYTCLHPDNTEELRECLIEETEADREADEMDNLRDQWESDPDSIVTPEVTEDPKS